LKDHTRKLLDKGVCGLDARGPENESERD
jgi:hypothetical protein